VGKGVRGMGSKTAGLCVERGPGGEGILHRSTGIGFDTSISDIYTGLPVNESYMSLDHFIPWSFVLHDRLWNLQYQNTETLARRRRERVRKRQQCAGEGICEGKFIPPGPEKYIRAVLRFKKRRGQNREEQSAKSLT
jgi:hypothetical protein